MAGKRRSSRPRRKVTVDEGFPFASVFDPFLDAYRRHGPTLLYAPTGRVVSSANVPALKRVVEIFAQEPEWSEQPWDIEVQRDLLDRLIDEGVHDPYRDDQSVEDATALVRMFIVVLKNLGLVRTDGTGDATHLVATEAGAQLAAADSSGEDRVLSSQIVKFQHPNPGTSGNYRHAFKGVLPHLLLLQVLEKTSGRLTSDEYRMFVNLAVSHDDVPTIVNYIAHYRGLSPDHQAELRNKAKEVNPVRWEQVRQNASYQLHFFTFPPYLRYDVEKGSVEIVDKEWVDEILGEFDGDLRLQEFDSPQDWQAYLGDPSQRPDWFTWLASRIEKAPSAASAKSVVRRHKTRIANLTKQQQDEVTRKATEKHIEDFYELHLELIDPGIQLWLLDYSGTHGRQFSTDVGPIDLLCVDEHGYYVVVEIKVGDPGDGAFGQILRYMGWVEGNLEGARGATRGVILAGAFSEKAKYSQMGFHIARDESPTDELSLLKLTKHGFQTEKA